MTSGDLAIDLSEKVTEHLINDFFNKLLIVLFHFLLCALGAELEVGQSTAPPMACLAREAASAWVKGGVGARGR